jgi:hypothetical protein
MAGWRVVPMIPKLSSFSPVEHGSEDTWPCGYSSFLQFASNDPQGQIIQLKNQPKNLTCRNKWFKWSKFPFMLYDNKIETGSFQIIRNKKASWTNSGYKTYIHGNVIMKLCVDTLNKQKCLFVPSPKKEDRNINQVLSGGWCQGEGEDIRKGWKWWEYYVLMYENGKMRPVETILRIVGGVKGWA